MPKYQFSRARSCNKYGGFRGSKQLRNTCATLKGSLKTEIGLQPKLSDVLVELIFALKLGHFSHRARTGFGSFKDYGNRMVVAACDDITPCHLATSLQVM